MLDFTKIRGTEFDNVTTDTLQMFNVKGQGHRSCLCQARNVYAVKCYKQERIS